MDVCNTSLTCEAYDTHVFVDELRPIAPSHLTTILELLLNCLVSLSLPHQAAPVEDLAAALEHDHEVRRDVTRQVMAWFGEVNAGLWTMDVDAMVREVGVGILRAYKVSYARTTSVCKGSMYS